MAPSAAGSVLLNHVMPVLGVILAIGVIASPTRTVWRTRKKTDLGEFNPLPTVVAVGNMCAWQGYALISHDPYLTASSGAAARCTCKLPHDTLVLMFAIFANAGSCVYYISPLSTAMKVFRTRNSASIHIGNSVMSVLNCCMWIGYLAGGKHILLMPTLTYYVGASFNLFCLFLCWRFPRRKVEAVVAGAELAGGAASQLASSPEDSSPVTPTHSATASRQGISAPRARSHHGAQPSVERLSSGTVAIALQALESGACGHGMQAGGPAGAERLVQAT
ncbi:hypothetical protein ABPG77_006912 [Micractinium sp. CCAP 211/92]